MSRKQSKNTISMAQLKFDTIVKQIVRIQSGESTSAFTMKELKAMHDELLAELNE